MKKLIFYTMMFLSVCALSSCSKQSNVKLAASATSLKAAKDFADKSNIGIADLADKSDVATADELN